MSTDQLFVAILISGLLTFGGLGSVPVLQNQLAPAHVPVNDLILDSIAVGYIAPGPNGLYLIAIGYFIGGVRGSLVATAAVLFPPLLVFGLAALKDRLFHFRRFRAALRSLSLAVIGILASSTLTLVAHATTGMMTASAVIIGAIALLMNVPPALILLGAACIGLIVR